MQNWTALVQVLEKQKVQVSKAGNRYQKLIFVDAEGRKVHALFYGSDINFFRNYFELYKRYLVFNAKVQHVQQNFSTYENECSWTIDNSTLVHEVEESEPPIIPHIFNFTPFTKFYQHIDSGSLIDIAAIVIHTNPRTAEGQTTNREIVVVDQRCNNNQDTILKLLADRAHEDRLKVFPPTEDDEIASIRGMLTMQEKNVFWIQGIPKLLDKSQKLWYYACPSCYKSIRAKPEWLIECTSCQKRIQVVPRCRLTIEFSDYSGAITIDLYGENALQLLPFTLSEIQHQELQNNIQHDVIEEGIKRNNILCLIKKAQTTYASSSNEKYTTLVAYLMNLSEEKWQVISKYTTNYAETTTVRRVEIEV